MIGVFATFCYGDRFDEHALRGIAKQASAKFVGLPGLRSKTFTINVETRQAVNIYVWNSEGAARAFFNDALLDRATALYGVRPSVEFVEIAALVENSIAADSVS